MSQQTQLTFFTASPLPDPAGACSQVLGLVRASRVLGASRTKGPDRSWLDFLRRLATPGRIVEEVGGEDEDDEHLGTDIPLEGVPSLLKKGTALRLWPESGAFARGLGQAIRESLPPEVRGDCAPAEPYLTVGEHDLFDDSLSERGQFLGRATLSLSLSSYGTPANTAVFRERIVQVDAIRSLRAQLEAIVGPVQAAVILSL